MNMPCADPGDGLGYQTPAPLENNKAEGFFRNTGFDLPPPLENQSYSASIHCRATTSPPAKRHLFTGYRGIVFFRNTGILLPRPLSNDPRFIQCIYRYSHSSKRFVEVYVREKRKKTSKLWTWTPAHPSSDEMFWIRACMQICI